MSITDHFGLLGLTAISDHCRVGRRVSLDRGIYGFLVYLNWREVLFHIVSPLPLLVQLGLGVWYFGRRESCFACAKMRPRLVRQRSYKAALLVVCVALSSEVCVAFAGPRPLLLEWQADSHRGLPFALR